MSDTVMIEVPTTARMLACCAGITADGHESKPAKSGARAAEYLGSQDEAEPEKASLLERLDARLFSPANKPEEPIPTFYLAGVGICTAGNLTTVSAQEKAGKSAGIGAMIASTFSEDGRDCLNFKSTNPNGLALVHLDTEQTPFDHWQLIDRVARRAGAATPNWLRSYCVTGFSFREIRESIRLALDQAAQKFGGVHSFFLDGDADAVADVNDPAESNAFVAELHALAIQYACPFIGVIHLNPNSDTKTRGHLGSQLVRKSETNLKLEKDGDGITVVWADKNRRAPIPKKYAPRFAWSDEHQMHVSITGTEQANEAEQLTEQIHEAFRMADKTALHYAEFIAALRRVPGIKSDSTAERVYRKAKALGIIKKNIFKQWELA